MLPLWGGVPLGPGPVLSVEVIFLRCLLSSCNVDSKFLPRLRCFLPGNVQVKKLAILDTHIPNGSWLNLADLSFAEFPTLHSEPCPSKVPAASFFEYWNCVLFGVSKNEWGYDPIWLVVSTPLKNMSQLGWFFPIYGEKCSKPPTSILHIIINQQQFCS